MTVRTSTSLWQKRRRIADRAIRAALETRTENGFDMKSPICVYGLCERIGVTVRFNDINMEGVYRPGPPAQIHLSSLRPIGRRCFTCAHELGHHVFNHGTKVDQLKKNLAANDGVDQEELLADIFAGALLLPVIGLRRAFAERNVTPGTALPTDLFSIACNFGVGYSTLINHLCYGIHEISGGRAIELLKNSPKSLREIFYPLDIKSPLVIADEYWSARTMDVEVGMTLILPSDSLVDPKTVHPKGQNDFGIIFKALRPGISRVQRPKDKQSFFVRVARQDYIGLAKYRHLEDPDFYQENS